MARSRDCSCVNGKDRDNNYKEVLKLVYASFEKQMKKKDKLITKLKVEISNNT